MKCVLVKIIEKWENLKKCFLSLLPKPKKFKRICKGLKDVQKHCGAFEWSINTTVPGHSCISVKPVWNLSYHILIRKVTHSPVIQWNEHLANILRNFENKKSLNVEQDSVSKLKSICDLVNIDLRKKENLKLANLIEIGTKALISFMAILQLMMQLLLFASLV